MELQTYCRRSARKANEPAFTIAKNSSSAIPFFFFFGSVPCYIERTLVYFVGGAGVLKIAALCLGHPSFQRMILCLKGCPVQIWFNDREPYGDGDDGKCPLLLQSKRVITE